MHYLWHRTKLLLGTFLVSIGILSCSVNPKTNGRKLDYFELCYHTYLGAGIAFNMDSSTCILGGYKVPVHYGHMSDSSKVILENSVLDMLKDSTIQSKEVTALDGSAMALLIVSERDTMFIFQQEPFQPKLEKLLNHLFLLDFQKDSICTLDLNNWKTWQEVMPPPSAPIGTKQIVFGE